MGYACDPHQQWADEGWGDDPEPSTCDRCAHYEPSPFPAGDFGLCMLHTEVSRHLTCIAWRYGHEEACEEYRE